MEPLSATASVISILDVSLRTCTALVKWAHDTRHAATERTLVAREASLLSSLLERLREKSKKTKTDDKWLLDRSNLLNQFQTAFQDLCRLIKLDLASGELVQESRLKAAFTSTRWTFSKSESFALLERISRLQQCANALLLDHQNSLLDQINDNKLDEAKNQLKVSILDWISTLKMSRLLHTIAERAVEGSGRWFLSSAVFNDWAGGRNRLLWGWGIPGAGKTTLVAIIMEYLQQQRTSDSNSGITGTAVLFLKYNDREQTLDNLLASLLRQLLQGVKIIPPALVELFERHSSQEYRPSINEIFTVLSKVIHEFNTIWLLVDGLDECPEEVRWSLIEKLLELPKQARILLTSRYLDSMDEELKQFKQLEIRANKNDLEMLVESQIKKNRNLRGMVRKHEKLRGEIKEKIVKGAEGMFLLARLHLESLASAAALSVKHVRKKLDSLPSTLKGTYDEALSRIKNQEEDHQAIAMKSLAWISYAFRPLLLRELQHVIELEPTSAELDEEALIEGHSIIALCAGLLVIDQDTSEVNLVHYTAKNYFEDTRHKLFPGYHATITLTCATYLNLDVLKNAQISEIVRWYPLACYAVQYMAEHTRQHPEETLDHSILELICQLFSRPDKRRPLIALLDGLDLINSGFYSSKDATLQFMTGHEYDRTDLGDLDTMIRRSNTICSEGTLVQSEESSGGLETESSLSRPDIWQGPIRASQGPEVTALHLAASMGLAKVASMLLQGTPDVDAMDENGNTALTVAMNRGFEKAVEFLIENGACVDLKHEHGRAILLFAAERKWNRVCDVILEKSMTTALVKQDSSAAAASFQHLINTIVAVYQGDPVQLRELVVVANKDLLTAYRDIWGFALFLCVERGHAELIPELVLMGVDVNTQDSAGQTSLHRAARNKDYATIKSLVELGIDINKQNDTGLTAFSASLPASDKQVLTTLLEAGANPNVKGHNGVTEMYLAGCEGDVERVRFLLNLGMSPSITTDFGWAPLHWASASGHIETVQVLLEAGADPNPISDQDTTPLDHAIQEKRDDVVAALRQARALQRKHLGSSPELSSEMQKLRVSPRPETSNNHNGRDSGVDRNRTVFVFDEPLHQNLHYGQFIYEPRGVTHGSNIPIVYNIQQPIDQPANKITVGRSKSRPVMADYYRDGGLDEYFDDSLTVYHIISQAINYQSLELVRNAAVAEQKKIMMKRAWTGSWHVQEQVDDATTPLFRTMPDWSSNKQEILRWTTSDGLVLARSYDTGDTPTIHLEPDMGEVMQDIVISCWIATIWYAHQTDRTNAGSK